MGMNSAPQMSPQEPTEEKGFKNEEEELDHIKEEATRKATEYFGSVEETKKYADLDKQFFAGADSPEAQKAKAMNTENNSAVKQNYAKLLMRVINGAEEAKLSKNEPPHPNRLPHDIFVKNIRDYATEIDDPKWTLNYETPQNHF